MSRAARSRGFTLIELLVALTGGLFVSIAVFALARDSSRFYQREGRMANATLAGLVGFERLRADISRAGFLITPNIFLDRRICSRPAAPAGLANLASIRLFDGGSGAVAANNATLQRNGLAPDRLVLAGSYSSSDEYPTRTITRAGTGYLVTLQTKVGPLSRLGWYSTNAAGRLQTLTNLFAQGRMLRIVNVQGKHQYGVINSVQLDPQGFPAIALDPAPALALQSDGDTTDCKLQGNGTGELVAVVNFIQYDVRNLNTTSNFGGANTSYSALYSASSEGGVPYEADRTELVRTELDAAGAPLPLRETMPDNTQRITNMEELVAEYAVDFQIEIGAVDGAALLEPSVAFVPNNQMAPLIGAVTGGSNPQRIRTVRARLSVRSREADRDEPITGFGGNLYRVGLGTAGATGRAPFARVRTFQSDVMLNNHTSITW